MTMDTKKFALITDGTSGIGLEFAKLLAADHYNLVIVSRNQQALDATSNELTRLHPIAVISIQKDLFDRDAPRVVHDALKAKGIVLDVLINNAGQGAYGEFIGTELDHELAIFQLNINACILFTKYVLKDMIARNSGKILNVCSMTGKVAGSYQAVYHGTKAFVHFFSEAVRNEIKETDVTVTSLLPSTADIDFFNKADVESPKIVQEDDLADPVEVAKDGYKAMMDGKDMVVSDHAPCPS